MAIHRTKQYISPIQTQQRLQKKAYIVSVDMGYGHERAIYPLRDIAASPPGWTNGHPINANTYPGIPIRDRRRWDESRHLYEIVSRFKSVPVVGPTAFGIMDYIQRIAPFYPKRDLSRPSFQLRQMYSMIGKGWGRDLITTLNQRPLPLVTSFFAVAFFAEEHGYKGQIFCLCTDTDVSRAWAPLQPKKSRIHYLAPNKRVKQRLALYGVREDHISVTGFPLPKELIGGKSLTFLKRNLGYRIGQLDPTGRYHSKYHHTLEYYLGARYCRVKTDHPLTVTFAVGGAGAQRELGATILESLHRFIDKRELRLNLIAGTRRDVYEYYDAVITDLHLKKRHGGMINIIYAENKLEYFQKFNQTLTTTDILWTKPSELSFYSGLGIPIIMAPTVGSQEEYNRAWLHSIGAGVEQNDPRYTHEWLFDWLHSGWFARAAMEGFMNAPHMGTYHIEDMVLRGKKSEIEDMHLL